MWKTELFLCDSQHQARSEMAKWVSMLAFHNLICLTHDIDVPLMKICCSNSVLQYTTILQTWPRSRYNITYQNTFHGQNIEIQDQTAPLKIYTLCSLPAVQLLWIKWGIIVAASHKMNNYWCFKNAVLTLHDRYYFINFCLLISFKINFFIKFFKNVITNVKQLGSRPSSTLCRAWSGSKLFAKVISRWHWLVQVKH